MIPHYEPHPIALLFPPHTEAQMEELRESLREDGFDPRRKIILRDGQILDGVGRYRACVEEEIEPEFAEYDGPNPLAFALRMNVKGLREWTPGQKAALAVKLLPQLKEEAKRRQSAAGGAHTPISPEKNGESASPGSRGSAPDKHAGEATAQAAAAVGVGRASVEIASQVAADGDDSPVLKALSTGVINLDVANRLRKLSKAAQVKACAAYRKFGKRDGDEVLAQEELKKGHRAKKRAAKPKPAPAAPLTAPPAHGSTDPFKDIDGLVFAIQEKLESVAREHGLAEDRNPHYRGSMATLRDHQQAVRRLKEWLKEK
jgi:hypothetical protein